MPRAGWWWPCLGLCGLLVGRAEAPSPREPLERSRPYAVLRGQNLGERRGRAGGGIGLRFRPWGAGSRAGGAGGGDERGLLVRGDLAGAWGQGRAARRQPGAQALGMARPGSWASIRVPSSRAGAQARPQGV